MLFMRKAIKAQLFIDFITECGKETKMEAKRISHPWRMYIDGASRVKGAGVSTIIKGLNGIQIEVAMRILFKTSNNATKYEALVAGLTEARELQLEKMIIYNDSQMIVI